MYDIYATYLHDISTECAAIARYVEDLSMVLVRLHGIFYGMYARLCYAMGFYTMLYPTVSWYMGA